MIRALSFVAEGTTELLRDEVSPEAMRRSRGDIIRLADQNTQEPGQEEVGLFAVPVHITRAGQCSWWLVDGAGRILTHNPVIANLVLWIVRNKAEHATLTDVARAFI